MFNIDSENNEKQLTYAEAEKLVTEKLLEKLKIKNTKLKSVNNFKKTNSENLNKIFGLKRFENKNLSNVFNDYIINDIFKSKIGEIKSINTATGILTFKIIKESSKMKFDPKTLKQIDNDFKENMLSDIQSSYYKNFETFHKIKSNLQPLDNLVKSN